MQPDIDSTYNKNEYDKLTSAINEALSSGAQAEDFAELYYKLGECNFNLKKYDEAKDAFSQSISFGKENRYSSSGYGNFMPKLMLARIHSLEGDIYNAVNRYIDSVFDPNNFENYGSEEAIEYLKSHNLREVLSEMITLIDNRNRSSNMIKSFKSLQSNYMDYPREVHIETTGRCNAACCFCPHSELDRKNSVMPDSLFLKIVNDLKEIPRSVEFHISPFKVNEPLMDKSFFEKMKVINRELPNASIRFFSNFNMADRYTPEKIAGIKKLSGVWVSLNSLDEEEYGKMMGLRLPRTIENIRLLFEYNQAKKFTDQIVILRVGDGTPNDEKFISDVNEIFGKYKEQFQVMVLSRGEWINHIKGSDNKLLSNPCLRWFEISVTCTGKVAFCCMDGKCEYSLGDVNKQSVLEIYNNSYYKSFRENGRERKFIEPCKFCSYD